jgi:hypothetical protein
LKGLASELAKEVEAMGCASGKELRPYAPVSPSDNQTPAVSLEESAPTTTSRAQMLTPAAASPTTAGAQISAAVPQDLVTAEPDSQYQQKHAHGHTGGQPSAAQATFSRTTTTDYHLRRLFQLLDQNCDKEISKSELTTVLTSLADWEGSELEALMRRLDASSNGKVTLDEYMAAVRRSDGVIEPSRQLYAVQPVQDAYDPMLLVNKLGNLVHAVNRKGKVLAWSGCVDDAATRWRRHSYIMERRQLTAGVKVTR